MGHTLLPDTALAAQHGYAHTIDYKSEDFVVRTKEITKQLNNTEGVDAVYDSVGKDTYPGSLHRPAWLSPVSGE